MKINSKYIFAAIIIAASSAAAIGSRMLGAPDDGPIEEEAESIIENQLGNTLDLPDGSLRGTIDLTPSSKE